MVAQADLGLRIGELLGLQRGGDWDAGDGGVYFPRRAVAKAKLPAGTKPHSLRHHYASVLLAAGESVVADAERLGHDSAKLVLDTYGHLLPDREEHTRRAIDDAWATLAASPVHSATAQGRPE